MASNYGLNFGFRRSDESMAIREGRLRTPAAGTFRIGSLVALDPAAPGFLKAAASAQVGSGGTVGLLVQEESHINSIYNSDHYDTFNSRFGVAKNNTLSVIWAGAGTKIWMRNTAGSTRADGRVIAAVTMVTLTGCAIGDYLMWNGTQYVKSVAGNETDSMLRITAVDVANGYVEAVLIR